MATESEVIAAVLAAINVNLPAGKKATEPSKLPSPRPREHTTVTIAERQGGTVRAGRRSTRGWQVYIFSASSTYESNVRLALEAAHTALYNAVLVIGDERTTPIAPGPSRAVGPDDGWFSGNKSYTFTV